MNNPKCPEHKQRWGSATDTSYCDIFELCPIEIPMRAYVRAGSLHGTPVWREEEVILLSDNTPGYKEDDGKTRYDLLPPELLEAVATILTYGTEKRGYPERNWEAGMDWGRPFAATQRHLWAWWNGEDLDESGYSHLWHAACEIAFLIAFEARGVGEDSRPLVAIDELCADTPPKVACPYTTEDYDSNCPDCRRANGEN